MKSFEIDQAREMFSIIFRWFDDNQRALPWRIDYAPYEVWISEMMLQQTQMERGVEYYLRWMQRFSSIEDVARASEGDILQAWEGLGYYSRARNVHATAKIICSEYAGEIPCDAELLHALPGLGDYTVAAIMGISFEKDFPTVDANVERVFSRLCNIESEKLKQIVTKEVTRIFPKGKARVFNQSWMEFGALLCKKVPQCDKCPITIFCESYKLGVQNSRPVLKKKAAIIPVHASFCIMHHVDKGYLLHRRPHKGLWADMWEFIGVDSFMLDTGKPDAFDTADTFGQQGDFAKNDKAIKANNILNDDLARSVLIKELETLFDIHINDENKLPDSEIKKQVPQTEQTEHTEQTEQGLVNQWNIFPRDACAHVKHSYTNHRLQAAFYRWNIDFDLMVGEDYKWVKDLDSVAMPAHHRKVASTQSTS